MDALGFEHLGQMSLGSICDTYEYVITANFEVEAIMYVRTIAIRP